MLANTGRTEEKVANDVAGELFSLIISSFSPIVGIEMSIKSAISEYGVDDQVSLKYKILMGKNPSGDRVQAMKTRALKILAENRDEITARFDQMKSRRKSSDVADFLNLLAEDKDEEDDLFFSDSSVAPEAIDCPVNFDTKILSGGKAVEILIDDKELRKLKGSTLNIKQLCPASRSSVVGIIDGRIIATWPANDDEEVD